MGRQGSWRGRRGAMRPDPVFLLLLVVICLPGLSRTSTIHRAQRPLERIVEGSSAHLDSTKHLFLLAGTDTQEIPKAPGDETLRSIRDLHGRLPFAPAMLLEGQPGKAQFENQRVIRVTAHSDEERLTTLSAVETFHLDLWGVQKAKNGTASHLIDIRVPSHYTDSMLDHLFPAWRTMIANVQELIRQNEEHQRQAYVSTSLEGEMLPPDQHPFHDSYHPWNEIRAFMEDLERSYPELVVPFTLGQSYQGRNISGIKIGKSRIVGERRSHPRNETEHVFILQGAQHAREWISPATVLYIAHKFVDDYTRGLSGKKPLLDSMSLLVLPTLNVDGYVYSWEKNRMWRKNRSPTAFPLCNGVDLNRNWNFKWDDADGGSSANPCSESYRGTEAFEGLEIKAMADYILEGSKAVGHHVVGYLDLHAYSQLLMFPYSYSCTEAAPSRENLLEASLGAARALKDVYGTSYVVGPVCDVIYRASGSSIDWTYAVGGIEHSFAAELRDTGIYGFLLPANQIKESGEETFAMVYYLARFVFEVDVDRAVKCKMLGWLGSTRPQATKSAQVLQVTSESPSQGLIEPYFDFITGFNGQRLERLEDLAHAASVQDTPLTLQVWSTRTQQSRDVTVTPSAAQVPEKADFSVKAQIGLTCQLAGISSTQDLVWHVLEVMADSPAEAAGLVPFTDYIIGWRDGVLTSKTSFYDLIEDLADNDIVLRVYNSDLDYTREVLVRPHRAWGGQGLLGCGIGHGLLHKIDFQHTGFQLHQATGT